MDANVITNITAIPIPAAVSIFFETPRKGHVPKNCENIILLTINDVINKLNKSISYLLSFLSS
jgi:hypothetical protein